MGGEHGYDGGKKIKGRKRHILTDVMGFVIAVLITAANVDDGIANPRTARGAVSARGGVNGKTSSFSECS